MGTNERLIAIGSRQHGRIARRQLAEAGIPEGTISRLVRDGIRLPRSRAVYALGHEAPSDDADLMEAVLAAGQGAVVSGLAAARLWSMSRRKRPVIEVSTPQQRRTAPRGTTVRSRCRIDDPDRSSVRGIPTTSPLRTLSDLSSRVEVDEVRFAIHEGLYRQHFTMETFRAYAQARSGLPNSRALHRAIEGYSMGDTGARSGLESAVRSHIGARFAIAPRMNWATPVDGGTVMSDMCWPELGICCEVDGPVHELAAARRRDAERDHRLAAARWLVFRIDYRDFASDPEAACSPLIDALWAAMTRRMR